MTRWAIAGVCVLGAGVLVAAHAREQGGRSGPGGDAGRAHPERERGEAHRPHEAPRSGFPGPTHAVTVLDRKAIAETADRIRLDTALTLNVDGGVKTDARFQQLD